MDSCSRGVSGERGRGCLRGRDGGSGAYSDVVRSWDVGGRRGMHCVSVRAAMKVRRR